jgi:hypothetical protein
VDCKTLKPETPKPETLQSVHRVLGSPFHTVLVFGFGTVFGTVFGFFWGF